MNRAPAWIRGRPARSWQPFWPSAGRTRKPCCSSRTRRPHSQARTGSSTWPSSIAPRPAGVLHDGRYSQMTILTVALKYLQGRLVASVLTAVSIALGVGLVVASVLVTGGIKEGFIAGTTDYNLIVGAKGSPTQLVLSVIFRMDLATPNIEYTTYRDLQQDSRVEVAVPVVVGDAYQGFRYVATNSAYFAAFPWRRKTFALSAGRLYADDPSNDPTYEALLGSEAAGRTGLRIGDRFYDGDQTADSGADPAKTHVRPAEPAPRDQRLAGDPGRSPERRAPDDLQHDGCGRGRALDDPGHCGRHRGALRVCLDVQRNVGAQARDRHDASVGRQARDRSRYRPCGVLCARGRRRRRRDPRWTRHCPPRRGAARKQRAGHESLPIQCDRTRGSSEHNSVGHPRG